MKKALPLLLIAILLVLLSLSFFWIYEARIFISRADQLRNTFSTTSSYTFTTPLRASADCRDGVAQESIRVYTIVLDDSGLPVSGQRVVLEQSDDLMIESVQGVTDEVGKAVIDVSSCSAGEYLQRISVSGLDLPQRVHLIFD